MTLCENSSVFLFCFVFLNTCFKPNVSVSRFVLCAFMCVQSAAAVSASGLIITLNIRSSVHVCLFFVSNKNKNVTINWKIPQLQTVAKF